MNEIDFGMAQIRANLAKGITPIPDELYKHVQAGDDLASERWLRHNKEHPWCQPYLVHLYVQDSRFALDTRPVAYFIRGSRNNHDYSSRAPVGPEVAGQTAEVLWQKWERPRNSSGIPSPYPDTVGHIDVTVIDEGDWLSFWNQAKRHAGPNFICVGSPLFPYYWTATNMPFRDYLHLHNHPNHSITDPWESDPGYDTLGNEVN